MSARKLTPVEREASRLRINARTRAWQIANPDKIAAYKLKGAARRKESMRLWRQAICFHYSNMQPLLAIENQRKGARYVG